MTLLEKIKPEHLLRLEQAKEEFPYAYEKIIRTLSNNDFLMNVTLGDINEITLFTKIEIGNIYELLK